MHTSEIESSQPIEKVVKIYETTYKKGFILGKLHFTHDGDLSSAITKVKNYLSVRHLKHLHTVPFIIDLDSDSNLTDLGESFTVNP